MSAQIDKWLGRLSGAYGLWPLVPAGVVAIITGFLSKSIQAIAPYGAIGWWSAGLLAFLITSVALYALATAREKWARAAAQNKWAKQVDKINPLDSQFTSKRISIQDVVSPITKKISNKQFNNCELMGPANIAIIGASSFIGVGFSQCDVCIVKVNSFLQNCIAIESCAVHGGLVHGCTIYVDSESYHSKFKPLGAIAVTFDALGQ